MFFIKNRLVKILTVLTVLLLFFSFGLFISDIISDNKVESVVIDYEPVHSLSSSDNLYYGTDNYVEGDYYLISGNTNFLLIDFLSWRNYYSSVNGYPLSSGELFGNFIESSVYAYGEYYLNYTVEDYFIENDILMFDINLYSNDYTILVYDGFSFDLSLFNSNNVYINVGFSYNGNDFNSLNEAWSYVYNSELECIYSDIVSIYFTPFLEYDGNPMPISLESAYELGYLKTQGTGIVEVVTSVFPLGLGILNAISSYFTALFFSNGSLSNFAIFSFVLVGISLVMGLTYVIYNYVKRKR